MATFVLVHGAWHGDWCWDRVRDELRVRGHASIAPDLPCDDISAGWGEYATHVSRGFEGVRGDIVLVGHSLGGGVIPLVADRRGVIRLVLLCSFPPEPCRSLDESLRDQPLLTDRRASAFRGTRDESDRFLWPDFESARTAMYHDCSEEVARRAFDRLRPQAAMPFTECWPLEAWPSLPTKFIVCEEDRMGRADALRQVVAQRFGADVTELPGGHSPFLSRPSGLTDALVA